MKVNNRSVWQAAMVMNGVNTDGVSEARDTEGRVERGDFSRGRSVGRGCEDRTNVRGARRSVGVGDGHRNGERIDRATILSPDFVSDGTSGGQRDRAASERERANVAAGGGLDRAGAAVRNRDRKGKRDASGNVAEVHTDTGGGVGLTGVVADGWLVQPAGVASKNSLRFGVDTVLIPLTRESELTAASEGRAT